MPALTDQQKKAPEMVADALTMRELAAVLVKHYGLHEGRYDLTIEFQVGVGSVGPDKGPRAPGVAVGIAKIGLSRSTAEGPMTVDAAESNPPTRTRRDTRRGT